MTDGKYQLEERTGKLGESVIRLCQKIRQDAVSRPIIDQLIRSGTSVGANYMEANGASSKTDFRNKIFLCKKEAQETRHWLRMLSVCAPDYKDELRSLWQETQELVMIFQKITSTLDRAKFEK